jgi:hypothetical protein
MSHHAINVLYLRVRKSVYSLLATYRNYDHIWVNILAGPLPKVA